MGIDDLTLREARRLFHYNPDTGAVVRRVTTSSRGRKGDRCDKAGTRKKSRDYKRISLLGERITVSRFIFFYMTGDWPKKFIDHRNRNKEDNRWSNLRETNNKFNMLNATVLKSNTSGVKGVSWRKKMSDWRAYITVDSVQKHLGVTAKFEEAVALRFAAEQCLGLDEWSYDSSAEKYMCST